MPELDEMKISDLTTAPAVADNTLLETSVEDTSNPGTYDSYKATLYAIFDKILNSTQFTQRLPNFINQTIFGAINELNDNKNIAVLFSTSDTYAVGDYVIYNGTLYKCISTVSTAGAWDASKWTPVVVTDEMGSGGGGNTDYVELTQAQYDALEQAGTLDPTVLYFITDGQSGNEIIDDTTTSASKVWSSDKTNTEIQAKQDDLTGGSLSNVDLDDYTSNGNYWVTQTSVLNKPVTNFGYLEVLRCSSSLYMQMFTAFGADNTTVKGETYVRFYANSQWYGWNKIADSTPETVKVTRTNLTQNAGVSRFSFASPAVTGYTRMVISANPSNSFIRLVRFEENGNNVDLFLNNDSTSSVTYDITIAVAYIKS